MMADTVDPVDPLAAAQAAALACLSAGKVTPIRPGVLERGVVKCVTAAQFLADMQPPTWVVDGLIQQSYLYAVTAPTNHGKTAVTLVLATCVAAGIPFAGMEVAKGGVLILCGENQDGFRLRMLATLASLGLTPENIAGSCWVYPQSGGLIGLLDQIKEDMRQAGNLSMVLVDTSVSFFDGADENDNMAALQHAIALRELTKLPGLPAVVANCHPTGSTLRENCVPRGGSAFLNEIDTNLTVWADGETSEFHWTRKKRGPDFDPILFEYRAVSFDYFGKKVPTVIARHIDEDRQVDIRKRRREDENRVLYEMLRNDEWTFSHMCGLVNFITKTGVPHKSKLSRVLSRLAAAELVRNTQRDGWHLTKKGKEEAALIR